MSKEGFNKFMSLPGVRRLYALCKKHKEMLLYVFFGSGATVVSVGSFLLFDRMMNELIANVLSWIVTVGFAYFTNRTWVFRSRVRGKDAWKELTSFYAGRLLTLGLEEGLLLVFVTYLAWNAMAVKIVAQVVVVVGNYVISKRFIFREDKTNI